MELGSSRGEARATQDDSELVSIGNAFPTVTTALSGRRDSECALPIIAPDRDWSPEEDSSETQPAASQLPVGDPIPASAPRDLVLSLRSRKEKQQRPTREAGTP